VALRSIESRLRYVDSPALLSGAPDRDPSGTRTMDCG